MHTYLLGLWEDMLRSVWEDTVPEVGVQAHL